MFFKAAKSCNFAIVMAKLLIDGKEYGIHAFVVQLRSLDTHRVVPGLEVGDLGKKFGFDATDNGYLRFHKLRIPRFNMLMQFATYVVSICNLYYMQFYHSFFFKKNLSLDFEFSNLKRWKK